METNVAGLGHLLLYQSGLDSSMLNVEKLPLRSALGL